ncbi:MAG TPA: FecR domain-containing protein [Pedobacter sp.]|uniref:FecR family protein n=1 Tax=Pedobacter sp. TaxID=1411316 RepID=UPI002C4B6C16|nr:FecR domain-containing protein [Pedobacter sp.]HMI04726.1 FecR domain-containing protein [Pedobacter sp.]
MTDELLIKFLLNETSEEEGITVQAWLEADSSNQAYFGQFEKIWKAGKKLAVLSTVNEQQAWLKFKERTSKRTTGSPEAIIRPLKQSLSWLKIAAILILIGGIWMTYNIFGPERYKDVIAENKVLTEQLPDGSELTLNKNSKISYVNNFKRHRHVKLSKGDVFFNVAHDKTRPFVIEINQVSVTVVGTSFNIKRLNGQTEVIVETGIVRVELNGQKIELHKGEKVLIGTAATVLLKEKNTDQLYNYYRSNLFIANNTPIQKVADVMNEAYGSQISISDPSLGAETISTTFKVDAGLEGNLKVIMETMGVKITRNENKILLSRLK